MRVCIVTTEFLGAGASGGNGVVARTLGRHLAARGVEVHAIVSRRRPGAAPTLSASKAYVDRTYDRSDLRG